MKSTTAAAALAVGLSLAALPIVAHSQSVFAYGTDCSSPEITIGNPMDQEISYISAKFVIEWQSGPNGTWQPDSELGGFFAELVPPHGYRTAHSYGLRHLCLMSSNHRIRIVKMDACVINGVNYRKECAEHLLPVKDLKTYQSAVIYQPQ